MSNDSTGITSCGETEFIWGERTYIMGIINVAPDSFSGDGLGYDIEAAVAQAQLFAADGADILDIGGESTRPDAAPISVEEELRRVIPVIERLAAEVPLPLSIDTYHSEVARRAVSFLPNGAMDTSPNGLPSVGLTSVSPDAMWGTIPP